MKKIIYIIVLLISVNCKSQNGNKNSGNNDSISVNGIEKLSSNKNYLKQSDYETFIRNYPNQQIMITEMLIFKENKYYFDNAKKYLNESLVLLEKDDVCLNCKGFIISLMHGLDIEDYMFFCNKVLDLYENDIIDDLVFLSIYLFEENFKKNFYNNRNNKELKKFAHKFYNSSKISQDQKDYLRKYLIR
ncbi:MAG: hypothetical protein HRT69_17680 [Flavobacteriaceae bacterium]|nr:hypothetical protein [Flavobacteriaceae bacterium]